MSILKLFQALDSTAPTVVLCMRVEGENITVMACKPGDQAWQNCADPASVSNQELYKATDELEWGMATYPVTIAGFTYQLFVNYKADQTLATSELGRHLKQIASAHNRTFTVAPQVEVLDLLNLIPEDSATLVMSIEFKERVYTILTWRCQTGGGIEMLKVDPPAFESALRVSGWRQTQPPVHQAGKQYNVLIERAEGERYLLTDQTDLQEYKKREQGLTAHFRLQHA